MIPHSRKMMPPYATFTHYQQWFHVYQDEVQQLPVCLCNRFMEASQSLYGENSIAEVHLHLVHPSKIRGILFITKTPKSLWIKRWLVKLIGRKGVFSPITVCEVSALMHRYLLCTVYDVMLVLCPVWSLGCKSLLQKHFYRLYVILLSFNKRLSNFGIIYIRAGPEYRLKGSSICGFIWTSIKVFIRQTCHIHHLRSKLLRQRYTNINKPEMAECKMCSRQTSYISCKWRIVSTRMVCSSDLTCI